MRSLLALVVLGVALSAAVLLRSSAQTSEDRLQGMGVQNEQATKKADIELASTSLMTSMRSVADSSQAHDDADPEPELVLTERPEEPDASGMTRTEKLEALIRVHELYLGSRQLGSKSSAAVEAGFVSRCVATVMQGDGRADYGDPLELAEKGGFSLRTEHPDQWVFAADRARFAFMKGEFPAYDLAMARSELVQKGLPTPAMTPEIEYEYELIYQKALATLGITTLDSGKDEGH